MHVAALQDITLAGQTIKRSCKLTPNPLCCSGVREVTPEDEVDMKAFPIDEEADLRSVGAKGPFGEKVIGHNTQVIAQMGVKKCI